jgi:hypothetical protein
VGGELTWWPKSRYVLFLEQELERLREELRRWQDAALVKEGLPALTPRAPKPPQRSTGKMLPSQFIRKMTNWARPDDKDKAN